MRPITPPTAQGDLHVRTTTYPIQTWGTELRVGRRRPGEESRLRRVVERWLLNRLARRGLDAAVLGPVHVQTGDTPRGTTLYGVVQSCSDVQAEDRDRVAHALHSRDGAGMVSSVVDASGWHAVVLVQSLEKQERAP